MIEETGDQVPRSRLRRVEMVLERSGAWLVQHWLALFIFGVGVFAALPVVAPLLSATGHDRTASTIYFAYRITCHQLPHRSWFIAGESAEYDWEAVSTQMGLSPDAGEAHAFHSPIRDPVMGYQVAYCQRDTATWTALLIAAALYGVLRNRRRIKALPLKLYVLALVPLGIDGVSQMLGFHESNALNRTVTGALFGAATAWLILPMLDAGMRDIAASQRKSKAAR